MKVQIIAAGKIKDRWLKDGISDYAKRLGKFFDLEIIEVPDASDDAQIERAKKIESESLLAKVKNNSFLLALDVAGKSLSSIELAEKLPLWLERGGANLTVLIAGSNGFSDDLLTKCDYRLSMSKMTFTHQMARLIFLEQLYRAVKINRNERYHK